MQQFQDVPTMLAIAMFGQPSLLEDQPVPLEWYTILACVAALPNVEQNTYAMHDLEQGSAPPGLLALGGQVVAQWDGLQPHSWGYGSVTLLHTRTGLGLEIAVAGSSMQSASTIYIIPGDLEGYLQ